MQKTSTVGQIVYDTLYIMENDAYEHCNGVNHTQTSIEQSNITENNSYMDDRKAKRYDSQLKLSTNTCTCYASTPMRKARPSRLGL